jgi:MFS transporter
VSITKYYAMRFASWLCDYLVLFAVPVLAYSVTADVRWSGAAVFFQWGPRLLGLSAAILRLDNIRQRTLMVVADLTRTATALVAGLLMAVYPGAVLPVLMIFAMVVGLCFELTFVGGEKIGLYLVRPEEQERFQSRLTAFEQAAMVLGPTVAGVVLSFPPPVLMFVAAGLFGVSLLMSTSVPAGGTAPTSTAKRTLRVTVRSALEDPVLRRIVLVTMGLNYVLALINGAAPQIAFGTFGTSSSELGLIYAASSVPAIVGLLAFHRLTSRVSLSTVGIAVAVGMCLAALGVALAARLWVFAGCLGAFLLLDSFFSVYIRVVRARRVPLENYAATVGLFGMLLIVPMPLAGLTLAAVGNLIDPAVLISASAAAVFIGAATTLPRGPALLAAPVALRGGTTRTSHGS